MPNFYNNIYRGRKVLVTGHTGFKGSWLSIWLKLLGAEISGYALPPGTNPNNFESSGLSEEMPGSFGDIRDYENIYNSIKSFKPEIIFHLAAQPIVRESYLNPKFTYETNILGLVNLFEAVRNTNSVKYVINVTSDKCYENNNAIRFYKETDPLGGYDPYSASKACSEIITGSYRNSFFKDKDIFIASARAGNVIGGGDWSDYRIIPDCVKAIVNHEKIIIRNPNYTRPWQHVLEPLSGYLQLGASLIEKGSEFAESFNFGPSNDLQFSVEDLVKQIILKWRGSYEIEGNKNSFHESQNLQLDCSKALQQLKWHPVLNINEALDYTVNWYRNYYESKTSALDLCTSQILSYSQKAKENNLIWAD